MKRKFVMCSVFGYFEKFYSIFDKDEYDRWTPCKIVYENDNFDEVSN